MRQTRFLLLGLLFAVSVQTGLAQRSPWLFEVGGWWESEITIPWFLTDSGQDEYTIERYFIPEDTVINGKKCLKLMKEDACQDAPQLAAILSVSGEKVYFKEHFKSDNWCLLYDFNPELDTPFNIFTPHFMVNEVPALYAQVKCVTREPAPEYGDIEILVFNEREIEPFETVWQPGYEWLYGIGSTTDVLSNGDFFITGRAGSRLVAAGMNEVTLFSLPRHTTGVNEVEVSDPSNEKDANIYDLTGRKVPNPLPDHLYIKSGKKFIKH